MSQHCPHCQQTIACPSLSNYEDYFACPHCHSALAHHEADIMLYALTFIVTLTTPLVTLAGVNILIAMAVTMLAYHFLRPVLFEPRFRLRIVKFFPEQ
ncbi:hypothetical protein BIZ37_24715 [Photobacterium sp. BZF1]|uniref:hypothetical protein n=1 Tax=Photobacterium sp. BZF1 TaxID=1904457 RepID=UPI001653D8B9|nr:hypothetical protein [Photobacterium sp. BZF1]MBC7005766.1 hypothetical protein [Photobacterium sp. BZF1]